MPADELLRVAVGLLADVVVEAGPLPARTLPLRRLVPRRRYHLAGSPVTVDLVRTSLAAAGEVPGGWSPEVLILARPLDVHLAEVWSTRVQHGQPVRWDTFAGRWARRDALPPSADLPHIAHHWAGKVGASRVHVLVDPTLADAARLVGLRRAPAVARDGYDVQELAPASTDLLRRLNQVLTVRARQPEVEGLVRRARALLPAREPAPLALPERHRAWAERRAEQVAATLRAGGYPVHGDLTGIAPRHLGPVAPRRSEVLASALETCLVLAADGGSSSRGAEGTAVTRP